MFRWGGHCGRLPYFNYKIWHRAYSSPKKNFFPLATFPGRLWSIKQQKAAEIEGNKWKTSERRAEIEGFLDHRWAGEWFPKARVRGPRTIHCHVGPTNSGKTHGAMQKLLGAERGVYCAPLRLLAMEMWERLNRAGRKCGLRTGEFSCGPIEEPESDYENNPIIACTTEMLDIDREFDVAVIDEIQMIADKQRGWAFTRALLGVNAKEVYVCGEEAAIKLIQMIANSLGDEIVIKRYERLAPLIISETSLNGRFSKLQAGDCVVSFSRRRIFSIKEEIEETTGNKCAVVYGSLPMENRTLQAKMFNERENGCQIMVASDAVGMGLNLNIKRIVFAEVVQQSETGIRKVPSSRIKQIAGRAGRFGFANATGEVTCLNEKDIDYVRDCMETPNEEYELAGIQPLTKHYEELYSYFPDLSLCSMLSATIESGKFDTHHFPCVSQDMQILAYSLLDFPRLSISDQITLSCAPVNLHCHLSINAFKSFVRHIETQCKFPFQFDMKDFANPRTFLSIVESSYKILDLYLWLSTRYPDIFVDKQAVIDKREALTNLVEKLLTKITKCASVKKPSISEVSIIDKIIDNLKNL